MAKIEIRIRRMREHGFLTPQRATPGAAAFDLRNAEGDFYLYPHDQHFVGCGFAFEIPAGHVGLVLCRSGIAKAGVSCHPGVIDSDFRGEVGVLLRRQKVRDAVADALPIRHGDRIAQLLVVPVLEANLVEVPELEATARGAGGFGSTGVR